jgi:hypothetical protein
LGKLDVVDWEPAVYSQSTTSSLPNHNFTYFNLIWKFLNTC